MLKKLSSASLVLLVTFFSLGLFAGAWQPIRSAEVRLFEQIYTSVTGKATALSASDQAVTEPSGRVIDSVTQNMPAWFLQLTDWTSIATPGLTLWQPDPVNQTDFLLTSNFPDSLAQTELELIFPAGIATPDVTIHTSFDGRILTPWEQDRQPVFNPWWQNYAALCIAVLWLFFLHLCYLRRSTILLVIAVFSLPVVSILANLILMLVNQWWLFLVPVNLAVLLAGSVYARLLTLGRDLDQTQKNLLADRSELYNLRLDRQELDRVYDHVKTHGASQELLPQVYQLAQGFERKRSYEKARQVYQLIKEQGGYQDTDTRLQHLQQVENQANGFVDTTQQTLVLDGSQLQLPELGRYQIIRELGRGSMGVVYLAKDPKINRELAIKTVRFDELSTEEIESVKQRFFREAQAAGRLNHPNIVTVFDVGEEQDLAYIAMDYVKGEPLSRYCDENNLLDYHEIFAAFAKVAHALQFAHDNEIVHRDIKPSNILYQTDTRTVKVSDFGIARMNDNRQTQTGIVLGSPSYMSPEQIRGEMLNGQSDIFSLGVSLYQSLTGHLPFAGENLPALAYAITQQKHRNVRDYRPELPSAATRIINKALQKEPEKRFADAEQMAKALAKAALDKD
jgi:tRNA A-37 threonylcarbamoyl transferase component Bud32